MLVYNETNVEKLTQAMQAHARGKQGLGGALDSSSIRTLPQPDTKAVERAVERYVKRNRQDARRARGLAAGSY
jgi:hypothetical protein